MPAKCLCWYLKRSKGSTTKRSHKHHNGLCIQFTIKNMFLVIIICKVLLERSLISIFLLGVQKTIFCTIIFAFPGWSRCWWWTSCWFHCDSHVCSLPPRLLELVEIKRLLELVKIKLLITPSWVLSDIFSFRTIWK